MSKSVTRAPSTSTWAPELDATRATRPPDITMLSWGYGHADSQSAKRRAHGVGGAGRSPRHEPAGVRGRGSEPTRRAADDARVDRAGARATARTEQAHWRRLGS